MAHLVKTLRRPQTLQMRITTFIGTNKNAVMCQIMTAMIAILLLQYLNNAAEYDRHMSNLVRSFEFT